MSVIWASTGATMERWALGRIWQSALMAKSKGMTPRMAVAMRMTPVMVRIMARLVLVGLRQTSRREWKRRMRGTDSTSMAFWTAPVQRRATSARRGAWFWDWALWEYPTRSTPRTGAVGSSVAMGA